MNCAALLACMYLMHVSQVDGNKTDELTSNYNRRSAEILNDVNFVNLNAYHSVPSLSLRMKRQAINPARKSSPTLVPAPFCSAPNEVNGQCTDIYSCVHMLKDVANPQPHLCTKNDGFVGLCCPRNDIDNQPSNTIIAQTEKLCGISNATMEEIGGNLDQSAVFPWIVGLYVKNLSNTEFVCGGVIITPNHIITAAHCIEENKNVYQATDVIVRFVDHSKISPYEESFLTTITRNVSQIIMHPDYDSCEFLNNIALVKIDIPISENPFINPLCINGISIKSPDNFIGQTAAAAGWEQLCDGNTKRTLLKVFQVTLVDNMECQKFQCQITDNKFLCGSQMGSDYSLCQEDAGGPLMIKLSNKWMLIGLMSTIKDCNQEFRRYTNIADYRNWIATNVL